MAPPETPPLVVVGLGASAGGIEPLCTVIGGLPADLSAAVLVVVHLNAAAPSVLDDILGRCGPLPASFVRGPTPLRAGHVYVAPPDHHLLVEDGQAVLSRAPRVNTMRPSVDMLFRSLAQTFGPECVGVVLSGTLDDGAAGLREISRAGGHTIVQDPSDAVFRGMPESALRAAAPDDIADAPSIAALIVSTVRRLSAGGPAHPPDQAAGKRSASRREGAPSAGDLGPSGRRKVAPPAEIPIPHPAHDPPEATSEPARAGGPPPGTPSELACPECGGVLWSQGGEPFRFRCRVGHSYSPESLVSRHSEKLESALWSAVVALEERADLFFRVSERLAEKGNRRLQARYEAGAEAAVRDARVLRGLVDGVLLPPLPPDE